MFLPAVVTALQLVSMLSPAGFASQHVSILVEAGILTDYFPLVLPVFTAPPKARSGGLIGSDFVKGAVFGAVVALLGVIIGAWVG